MEQTTPLETDDTPEVPVEDSQDQAEEQALRTALNQVDVNALFDGDMPAPAETPPDEEGEKEIPEQEVETKQPPKDETKPEGAANRFKGLATVHGKKIEVDIDGDELTRLVQKGLAWEERDKWDGERESEVRKEEREKVVAELDSESALQRAIYRDFVYMYQNDPDFKEYWDEVRKVNAGNLPGTAEYGKHKPGSASAPNAEVQQLRAEINALKEAQAAEKAHSLVMGLVKDLESEHPGVNAKAVVDYAVKNGMTIAAFGEKALRLAYNAMVGEGLIKPQAKPGQGVVEQIQKSKKVPPIPAGTTGGRVGPVNDLDREYADFKREAIRKLPDNPDELFK